MYIDELHKFCTIFFESCVVKDLLRAVFAINNKAYRRKWSNAINPVKSIFTPSIEILKLQQVYKQIHNINNGHTSLFRTQDQQQQHSMDGFSGGNQHQQQHQQSSVVDLCSRRVYQKRHHSQPDPLPIQTEKSLFVEIAYTKNIY